MYIISSIHCMSYKPVYLQSSLIPFGDTLNSPFLFYKFTLVNMIDGSLAKGATLKETYHIDKCSAIILVFILSFQNLNSRNTDIQSIFLVYQTELPSFITRTLPSPTTTDTQFTLVQGLNF